MPGCKTGLRSKQATPTQTEKCGPFIRDTDPTKTQISYLKARKFTQYHRHSGTGKRTAYSSCKSSADYIRRSTGTKRLRGKKIKRFFLGSEGKLHLSNVEIMSQKAFSHCRTTHHGYGYRKDSWAHGFLLFDSNSQSSPTHQTQG